MKTKYALVGVYGDMGVTYLGTTLTQIKRNLVKFWDEEITFPEDYDEDHIVSVNKILNKDYSNIAELSDDYQKLIDNDYMFEEIN